MTLSTSPLCPHFELDIGPLASWPVKPQAVKVFTVGHAREVKAIDPAIVTVYRRFVGEGTEYLAQGENGGRRFVAEIPDLAGVDILEGLNECTGFDNPTLIKQANAFHVGFVAACIQRRVTPCILNIAVGNPLEALVHHLAPCVQAAAMAGGYIGYHGYGPVEMLHGEEFLANRGPLKLEALLRQAGVTAPIRWIYTEAGLDECNSPVLSGPIGDVLGRSWNGELVNEGYLIQQHEGFASRLVTLKVKYAFLYTLRGSAEWVDYDYLRWLKLAAWYRGHLESWQGPPSPTLPEYGRTTTGLYIRRGPGAQPPHKGIVNPGEVVKVIRQVGDSYEVEIRGFVPARFIEPFEP